MSFADERDDEPAQTTCENSHLISVRLTGPQRDALQDAAVRAFDATHDPLEAAALARLLAAMEPAR